MPRRAVEGQVLRRIAAICATGADDRALRHEVLEQVSRCVPFDAHAWLMTDPETSVGSSPLADVPFLAELPTLVGLKYRTGLPERYGCWGFLDLWRVAPGLPFAPDEVRFLGQLGPMVTAALRHAQASTLSTRRRAGAVPGPVVLLLSPRLEVRARTPQTDRYLERLVPPREGARAVPAGAYNVAAQLLAVETGVDGNPPRARVHLWDDVWLTTSAARIPHEHRHRNRTSPSPSS